MQQTKNYKLNLIETSDTFSPAPLNENAQKTEDALAALHAADTALTGAVAAAEGRNCLVRLGGPLVAQTDGEVLSFDLSGIDLGQFAALLLLGGKPKGSTFLQLNDDSTLRYAMNGATASPLAGYALLYDSGDGHTIVSPYFSVSCWGQTFNLPMSEIWKISLSDSTSPGAHFTLYGIRA